MAFFLVRQDTGIGVRPRPADYNVLMTALDPSFDLPAPCPYCGYDLRGHPEGAVCPECGRWVLAGQWRWEMSRWVDGRILDLWCIAVIQATAVGVVLFSAAAILFEQAWAAGFGAVSLLYGLIATIWYGWVAAGYLSRFRRHSFRAYPFRHRRRLFAWLVIDGLLILLPPALGLLLAACA